MIVINRKGANHRTNVIQIYFLKGNHFKRSRIYIIGIKDFQRLQIAVGRSLVVRSGVLLIQERDASQLKRLNGRSVLTSKRLQLRFRRHWTKTHTFVEICNKLITNQKWRSIILTEWAVFGIVWPKFGMNAMSS